jgi:large subunit ribosomal protein L24
MKKIKVGDTVVVTKGKDSGKKGKVIRFYAADARALVEGVNLAKKHKRQTQQNQQGGIVDIEKPISVSNLAIFCKECGKATRVGFTLSADGKKERVCKKCKGVI